MLDKLKPFENDIKARIPEQIEISFNLESWQQAYPSINFPSNGKITREQVLEAFRQYYNGVNPDYLTPYILTMAWGHGRTGFGIKWVGIQLSEDSKPLIKQAFDEISKREYENAYKNLCKVKKLGISFISKLMYFAALGSNQKDPYPLIFDDRMAKALGNLLVSPPFGYAYIALGNKFKDYENYYTQIHIISKDLKVEPVKLEYFLFEKGKK